MRLRICRSTFRLVGFSAAAWLALACSDGTATGVLPDGTGGSAAATGGGGGLGSGGMKAAAGSGGSSLGSGGTGGTSSAGSAGAGAPAAGGRSGASGTGGSGNAPAAGAGGTPVVTTGGSAGTGGGSGGSGMGGGAGRGMGGTGAAGMGAAGMGAAGMGAGGRLGGMGGMGGKSGSGGKASGGTGNVPAIGPGPCECETTAGEFGTVNATIVVDAGEVYDGGCKIFRANPDTLGAGDQEEGQLPIFRVNDGGTLRNVVIGASGADGVHTYGDVTLENIHWLDIGEDAMTVKESGTVNLNCGSSAHGEDKTFQVNAASTIFISNFTATDAGKFMRQNGDTTFEVNVTIDHSDISSMDECVFRTDSSSSHVTFTNSRYSNIGDGLFIFGDNVVNGNSGQSTVSNIDEY
jgi:hypothetical protein